MDSVKEPAVDTAHLTHASEADTVEEQLRHFVPGSPEEKRLVRKIDLYLMPILWIKYVFNYIDRTNIGNAKIAGMQRDLRLTDDGFAWVLSIFFFGYLLCEVPSNMALSRSRPSVFLPTLMLVWGALSACMAAAHSYAALLALRFVLGCVESGFFPGVLYVLSCWYTRAELGKRFAVFYTAAVLSGALGGILAGAIAENMHDARGIAGWRWLFIVEGAATVAVALVSYFVLLDYPATSKKLTPEERRLAALRVLHDGVANGAVGRPQLSHWQAFLAAVSDPRTYMFILLYMLDVGAGTISYFIPTITLSLGYDTVKAQYMTVPIYAVAAVCLTVVAWSSDRRVERRWHVAGALAVGFVGCVVCVAVQNAVVRYVMICFVAVGIWSALPLILSWTSGAVSQPPEKRAIVLALVNAFGNFSSVYGSRIWPKTDAPGYHVGFGATAGFLGAGMVLAVLVPILCRLLRARIPKDDDADSISEERAAK
ncbi:Major facilitator superfamily domain, general substrate transporter [Cordyceps fumosorosea ARSEF 2679]|uniref:Major facilitator superfamily domain, general substrate transporter n=1 Tax=Cordyceps fumosorosea (strain ARSEF 2679) TaxID=1081104 RepID=A0A168EKW0_CORFA|nr:Major facilitator superfamily domain, general substrate transporter [Cordyceps fumosorosea ARSEF 2679]OAA73931.1 Major facilitator superfamily domain, general substrate transporter [Cordyceps fumosorosea ARSEF 2679]